MLWLSNTGLESAWRFCDAVLSLELRIKVQAAFIQALGWRSKRQSWLRWNKKIIPFEYQNHTWFISGLFFFFFLRKFGLFLIIIFTALVPEPETGQDFFAQGAVRTQALLTDAVLIVYDPGRLFHSLILSFCLNWFSRDAKGITCHVLILWLTWLGSSLSQPSPDKAEGHLLS